MINKDILSHLSEITAEEREILEGRDGIDRDIYMHGEKNIINAEKLLNAGKLITIRPHTRFVHFPEHTHDYIELVFMCSGSTTHIINGEKILLNEGELLMLGRSARQEILAAGKGDIAVNFIILPQFFGNVLNMLGSEETPIKTFLVENLGSRNGDVSFLHFRVSDVLPVQNLIENLLWTLIHDAPNKRNINQITFGLLFLNLLNHTDKLAISVSSQKAVMGVFRYIEENYRTASLSDIANELHYDFYWLSREIKRQTGKTYKTLLQEKRLSQAAYLLKNTNMRIADISVSVGYENISFFHRIFSARYGVSPKQYRSGKANFKS